MPKHRLNNQYEDMLDKEFSSDYIIMILYSNYSSYVSYAYSVIKDIHLAEDIVQDVARKTFEINPHINNRKHCQCYLFKAIRNQSLNAIKAKQKTVIQPDEWFAKEVKIDFDLCKEYEFYEWVNKALIKISSENKIAFMRHIIRGEQINKLAMRMGVRPNTLRQRFFLIRQRLAVYYEENIKNI